METESIVLCGSTKFKKEFLSVAEQLEKERKKVSMPNVFEHAEGIVRSAVERVVMSRNLTKTAPFKVWWFLEHPKNERLQQIAVFKPRWRIVFLIDRKHFRKIDVAEAVFVLDVEGYIGESTCKETDYAIEIGKPVFYFSQNFGGKDGN